MISNNAKTFRSSSKEVCVIVQSSEVLQYFPTIKSHGNLLLKEPPGGGLLGKNDQNSKTENNGPNFFYH